MPKQEPASNAELWAVVKQHINQASVAKIPKGPDQLAEIDRRLEALTEDFAGIGAAITPTAAQAALGLDADTYNRWQQGKASQRDEKGNHVDVTLDKSSLDEAEKRYIIARAETIKKWLVNGEIIASTAAQAKDNRENGGSLFILQNVYGVGQDKAKDQITVSLEDLLAAAAAIKDRAGKT